VTNPIRIVRRWEGLDSVLRRWFGTDVLQQSEPALLETIRESEIPDPDSLRARLAAVQDQIAATEVEWGRLHGSIDAADFLELTPLATRLQYLRDAAGALPSRITSAARRRDAFLALARMWEAAAADVSARLLALIDHPPADAAERVANLRRLDEAARLHRLIAGRLSLVSTSPQFRRPPDALRVMRDELEARIRELQRVRMSGGATSDGWPAEIADLVAALEQEDGRRTDA
jgi:hypothetical protein